MTDDDRSVPAQPGPARQVHWWQRATGYQIYPRSFKDSDGDGIGDIPGIIEKLDYLQRLGIGFVWLSPVYASPMADNGYDISDYRAIAPEFGTLADFDRLMAEARLRGIGIVMDLVVNHTSDRHAWFLAARANPQAAARDHYIWRDPRPDGGPPDDRQSYFGGPAWTLAPETGQYYLHLFTPEQPDLNWRNPALRAEIHDIMRWWLDRGIAGFRMDVIDLIGKDLDTGVIEEGPMLHPYLQEMHRAALAGRDIVTIGESWNVTPETALLYCGRDRGELSMVFQFAHIVQGWDEVHGKWRPRAFDLVGFKKVLNDWQAALADDGWNALFLGNHDLPRMVSTYGDDGEHRVASASMLAIALHLMRGTPFIFQGDEIGMTNADFTRIGQFRDIETLNHHAIETAGGVSEAEFLRGANANGRDNARTPMQWTGGPQAGFTTGTPWIEVNPNHDRINAEDALADPDSIFACHAALTRLRRDHPVIVSGRYLPFAGDDPRIFAYLRESPGARLAVIANFTGERAEFDVPEGLATRGRWLIGNGPTRDAVEGRIVLAPFEAMAILG